MPVKSAVVVNTFRCPGTSAPPKVGSRKYFCASSQVMTSRTLVRPAGNFAAFRRPLPRNCWPPRDGRCQRGHAGGVAVFRFSRGALGIEPIDHCVFNFAGIAQDVAFVKTQDPVEIVDPGYVAISGAGLDHVFPFASPALRGRTPAPGRVDEFPPTFDCLAVDHSLCATPRCRCWAPVAGYRKFLAGKAPDVPTSHAATAEETASGANRNVRPGARFEMKVRCGTALQPPRHTTSKTATAQSRVPRWKTQNWERAEW